MKAWLGQFFLKCARAYENKEVQESPRVSQGRGVMSLADRLGGHNTPAMIAYKINNGFIIDSPTGMTYCADAKSIAEAIVTSETKQKIGLKTHGYPQESNAIAAHGGF